jgi:hypothetical protein
MEEYTDRLSLPRDGSGVRPGAPICAPSRTECLTSRASVRAIACSTSQPERESKTPINPVVADTAMAKAWYEKARDLGSAEAADRLKRLTSGRSPRR